MNNLSMFQEFEETIKKYNELSKVFGDDTINKIMPAMIILERKTTGENKHAIIGQPTDVFIAFEWGISQYCKGLGISFEDGLELIKGAHDSIASHISIYDYKE